MHYTAQQSTATSDRKAEANRANAQKSTGPTTQSGKLRSSQNSKRHGLLAGAATLLAQPNQELQDLLTRYTADFRPAGPHEEMLVRELAVADFRIRQIDRMEMGIMAFQAQFAYEEFLMTTNPDNNPEDSEPPHFSELGKDVQTLMLAASWSANPNSFSLLIRYQAQARRDYYRALKQLDEQVRSGKAAYLPETAVDQTNPIEQPSKPETPATAKNQTNPNPAPDNHAPTHPYSPQPASESARPDFPLYPKPFVSQ